MVSRYRNLLSGRASKAEWLADRIGRERLADLLPVEPDGARQIGHPSPVPHNASGANFAFGAASIFRLVLCIIFRCVCCDGYPKSGTPACIWRHM